MDSHLSNSVFAVFPGQGAQSVGMGKDLYENFNIAREVFEEASDFSKLNIKKLCFEGPESDLTLTEHTQPCLLTVSVAAFRVAERELGFTPSAVAGHSLGEYSALVASKSLSLGRAAQWVRERGAAMQRAVPAGQGGMAAIMGMEDEKVERLCKAATASAAEKRATGAVSELTVDPIVEPANFNAPGQVVIAGSNDAVAEAIALVKAGGDFAGGKAIPLQVSAPFHCKLMAPARARMAELFSKADPADRPKQPSCVYVPNRTARLTREAGLVFELLIDQVDHPVLWKQSVSALLQNGFTHVVEFGPGKVLTGLIKRISQPIGQSSGKTCTSANVSDSAGIKGLESFIATIGRSPVSEGARS